MSFFSLPFVFKKQPDKICEPVEPKIKDKPPESLYSVVYNSDDTVDIKIGRGFEVLTVNGAGLDQFIKFLSSVRSIIRENDRLKSTDFSQYDATPTNEG